MIRDRIVNLLSGGLSTDADLMYTGRNYPAQTQLIETAPKAYEKPLSHESAQKKTPIHTQKRKSKDSPVNQLLLPKPHCLLYRHGQFRLQRLQRFVCWKIKSVEAAYISEII